MLAMARQTKRPVTALLAVLLAAPLGAAALAGPERGPDRPASASPAPRSGLPSASAPQPAGPPADAVLELIFGGAFEEADLIAWDLFVGQCDVDPQCPTQLRFLARCLDDLCEECVDSNDCLNNPTALGPTCVAGVCRCASDAECAANPAGPVCDLVAQVCTCASLDHCAPPRSGTCKETPYLGGLTTCWGAAPPPLARAVDSASR